jgi:hypothetical protein
LTRDEEASTAVEVVTDFLRLMEERDLVAASRYIAPDLDIVFPGDRHFGDLEALVESAGKRYREVAKNIELVESMSDDTGSVVYVIGRLSGVDASGASFENVRFIDRLVVREGLITDHRVWNDLAETGVVARREPAGESSG